MHPFSAAIERKAWVAMDRFSEYIFFCADPSIEAKKSACIYEELLSLITH